MIRFENLHKGFDGKQVLRGISLTVARGSVHFIIGRSGAGKSVLIKQLVGLLRPDSGRALFDGICVTDMSESELFAIRRRCQLIFQHATLFDAMSVLENVAMPLRKRFDLRRDEANDRALDALDKVHSRSMADRLPTELGAGVRKRVAIARAIGLEPEALLYDEPTTSLDPVAARRTDRLIREMADRLGLTSLVVSHDLTSVRDIGDRVTFLHRGKVCFDGTPDELFSSRDADVSNFVHGRTARWTPPAVARR